MPLTATRVAATGPNGSGLARSLPGGRDSVRDLRHLSPVNVFVYEDYRRLLGDYYRLKKEVQPSFSYRVFARRAGVGSPSHVKRVIDGDRNLSLELAGRFAVAMDLKQRERAYFCDLVQFCQARTHAGKQSAFEALLRYKGYREANHLGIQHARYLSHWYVPAIREMAATRGFRRQPAWIAKRLRPAISTKQAADALAILTDLGMLEERDGSLVPSSTVLSTGPVAKGVHIVAYHQAMLERGSDALVAIGPDERSISGVTLRLTTVQEAKLRQMIDDFRKDAIGLENQASPSKVFYLGIQLFPMTESLR